MGCCVSTLDDNKKNKTNLTKLNSSSPSKAHQFSCVSKSPPRPEEETVKEVLSETPKSRPKPIPKAHLEPKVEEVPIVAQEEEEPTKNKLNVSPKKANLEQKLPYLEKKLATLEEKKVPMMKDPKYPDPSTPEEISEVSEMCSLSESNISNTTLEEVQWGKDVSSNNANVGVQRVYKYQGYNGHYNRESTGSSNNVQLSRNHGRSPVRRADPSPPRRMYSGPNSGMGQVGSRRDVVRENSARRSRSPATRSNVGRSPSARRTGESPSRVRMVHGPDSGRKAGDENVNGNSNSNLNGNRHGKEVEVSKESEWEGPKESLENPLVSLECFIFL